MSEEQHVAVIASTYDGQPMQAWPFGLMLRHVSDTLEVRGSDSTRLGLSGVAARPRRGHRRVILYAGWLSNDPESEADPRASFAAGRLAFENLFSLTGHAALVETLEDGTTRTIEARVRNRSLDREGTGLPELAEVSVEFESHESPDWEYGGGS